MPETVIILGAAGRDFHNFNLLFRADPNYRVVAFTAAQIPDIEGRLYPKELAGEGYPQGIPIHPETELAELIRQHRVDRVVFSYSDISYSELMSKAALVTAAGADFLLIAPRRTMLPARRPVVAVGAVRTGCGKSSTTRRVCQILQGWGKKVAVVRHPMPYGDLRLQAVQRFATYDDFDRHGCTIEEREEYEPLVEAGITVHAGIDYGRILAAAEAEAELIVWDGGNNDTPFFVPDLHIVLVDPPRPGHERLYYPGETNLRLADIVVIGKVDSASAEQVETVRRSAVELAPGADIVLAESALLVDEPERIAGRRVLVVEDGPTLTHGGMAFGAGVLAARKYGAAQLVDPRPWAVGSIAETFRRYPHLQLALPAIGYSPRQMEELAATINAADCDLVLFATPIDLARLLPVRHPTVRVRYEYRDHGEPTLEEVLRGDALAIMRWNA
ncbi:MAG: GTPase [Desulfuromonadales bacterium]|nr:GTPase [Desulfuromonadales bacterium]